MDEMDDALYHFDPKTPTPAEMIMLLTGFMHFFGYVLTSTGWDDIEWWAGKDKKGTR